MAQIQVQGNTITPDAETIALAGLSIGMPLGENTIAAATARLEDSGRFDEVQVLKRFASIADPSRIVLVLIVHEPGAAIEIPGAGTAARIVRRRGPGLQYLPLLDYDDGYGWTYGVQLARQRPLGAHSRLTAPITWGAERKAGATLERTFAAAPVTRVEAGGALTRQLHPFYEAAERRDRVWLRAERAFGLSARLGATADWQRVSLGGGEADRVPSIGADASLDTRVDPWLARNAIWARAEWRRADFPTGAVNLTAIDARGYVALPGQPVLVVHVLREGADAPVPAYAKALLGGADTLRGFHVGEAVGDMLAAGSVEIRAPLNSPLTVAKLGVSAFIDAAAVYDDGERLRKQKFSRGVGGSAWLSLAMVRLELTLAHGLGASTRVTFGLSTGF